MAPKTPFYMSGYFLYDAEDDTRRLLQTPYPMPARQPFLTMHADDALKSPRLSIFATFAAWKLFLLAIVVGSALVGDAYDTSGSLALALLGTGGPTASNGIGVRPTPTWTRTILTRLTSWDAVYFVASARRWYEFEQEWAFGTGLPLTIGAWVRVSRSLGLVPSDGNVGDYPLEALVGVLVSSTSHLLSALVLYQLGLAVWQDRRRALLAATAHVLSPAGLFLSAPYAESTFSLLSFTGYLLLAHSCHAAAHSGARRDAFTLLAGAAFGLATAFRSNGILNGLPLAWEFLQVLSTLPTQLQSQKSRGTGLISALRRLVVLGFSGISVALGYIIPQVIGYQHFCSRTARGSGLDEPARPWCTGYPPSLYTYVQGHYWDNGFLRYWTVSNLPLFLLAGPMLFILIKSGIDLVSSMYQPDAKRKLTASLGLTSLIQSAAAAQILLAVLVFVNHNVQIISRISSGNPVWYLWLADSLVSKDDAGLGRGILTFMAMYASIQGALFASFLPPA